MAQRRGNSQPTGSECSASQDAAPVRRSTRQGSRRSSLAPSETSPGSTPAKRAKRGDGHVGAKSSNGTPTKGKSPVAGVRTSARQRRARDVAREVSAQEPTPPSPGHTQKTKTKTKAKTKKETAEVKGEEATKKNGKQHDSIVNLPKDEEPTFRPSQDTTFEEADTMGDDALKEILGGSSENINMQEDATYSQFDSNISFTDSDSSSYGPARGNGHGYISSSSDSLRAPRCDSSSDDDLGIKREKETSAPWQTLSIPNEVEDKVDNVLYVSYEHCYYPVIVLKSFLSDGRFDPRVKTVEEQMEESIQDDLRKELQLQLEDSAYKSGVLEYDVVVYQTGEIQTIARYKLFTKKMLNKRNKEIENASWRKGMKAHNEDSAYTERTSSGRTVVKHYSESSDEDDDDDADTGNNYGQNINGYQFGNTLLNSSQPEIGSTPLTQNASSIALYTKSEDEVRRTNERLKPYFKELFTNLDYLIDMYKSIEHECVLKVSDVKEDLVNKFKDALLSGGESTRTCLSILKDKNLHLLYKIFSEEDLKKYFYVAPDVDVQPIGRNWTIDSDIVNIIKYLESQTEGSRDDGKSKLELPEDTFVEEIPASSWWNILSCKHTNCKLYFTEKQTDRIDSIVSDFLEDWDVMDVKKLGLLVKPELFIQYILRTHPEDYPEDEPYGYAEAWRDYMANLTMKKLFPNPNLFRPSVEGIPIEEQPIWDYVYSLRDDYHLEFAYTELPE